MKWTIHLLVIFLLYILLQVTLPTPNPTNSLQQVKNSNDEMVNPQNHFERSLFFSGVKNAQRKENVSTKNIKGVIAPHHLLPSAMISYAWQHLPGQNINTIILMGPNHEEKNSGYVLTNSHPWQTPFGLLYPSPRMASLHNSNIFKEDSLTTTTDHSVSSIVHYQKYYLPESRIIPLLISNRITDDGQAEIVRHLTNLLDENTVIVLAADFSHYHDSQNAQRFDKTTLEIINSFNAHKASQLNNDYTDSPVSLAIFLQIMSSISATQVKILENTNSGEILNNPYLQITSYITALFTSHL